MAINMDPKIRRTDRNRHMLIDALKDRKETGDHIKQIIAWGKDPANMRHNVLDHLIEVCDQRRLTEIIEAFWKNYVPQALKHLEAAKHNVWSKESIELRCYAVLKHSAIMTDQERKIFDTLEAMQFAAATPNEAPMVAFVHKKTGPKGKRGATGYNKKFKK